MSDTITLWEFPQEFYDDKGTWLLEMAGGRERTFRQKVAWLPTKVYEAFRVHNQMGEWCDDVESKEVWVEVSE